MRAVKHVRLPRKLAAACSVHQSGHGVTNASGVGVPGLCRLCRRRRNIVRADRLGERGNGEVRARRGAARDERDDRVVLSRHARGRGFVSLTGSDAILHCISGKSDISKGSRPEKLSENRKLSKKQIAENSQKILATRAPHTIRIRLQFANGGRVDADRRRIVPHGRHGREREHLGDRAVRRSRRRRDCDVARDPARLYGHQRGRPRRCGVFSDTGKAQLQEAISIFITVSQP